MFTAQVTTADFELALLKSSKWFWPDAKQVGCYVHFLRCQINQLKKLGLLKQESKKLTYQLVTLISSLVFIQEQDVKAVFECMRDFPKFASYTGYFNYFNDVWIDGHFPIKLWSVAAKKDLDPSYSEWMKYSNNMIESFHGVLNYALKKSVKPTMLEFITGLKFIEANAINNLNTYDDKYNYDVKHLILSL